MGLYIKRGLYLIGIFLVSVAFAMPPAMAAQPGKVKVDRMDWRADARGEDGGRDKDKEKDKEKKEKKEKKCPTKPCPHGHGEDEDDD